ADLSPLWLKFVIEAAGAHLIPDLLSDLVDGLEDGHTPAWLQHAVELPNSRLLVGDVDQNRTRHNRVETLARQGKVGYVSADISEGNGPRYGLLLAPTLPERVDGEIQSHHAPRPF